MKLLLLLAAVAVGVYFLRKQLKKVKADSPKLPVEKAPELPLKRTKTIRKLIVFLCNLSN